MSVAPLPPKLKWSEKANVKSYVILENIVCRYDINDEVPFNWNFPDY